MALVTCPECGKKNVSDTATACPNCGYHIADYFTQLNKAKREDERKKAEIDELTKKGVLSASTIKGIQEGRNMDKEIKRDKEIDKQKIPEDNSQSLKSNQAGFWFGGIFVGLGLLGIILAATLDELSFGMFLIYGFLIGLGVWVHLGLPMRKTKPNINSIRSLENANTRNASMKKKNAPKPIKTLSPHFTNNSNSKHPLYGVPCAICLQEKRFLQPGA